MNVGAALSTLESPREAAIEAALGAHRQIDRRTPQLAVVFASPHAAPHAAAVVDAVHEAAGPGALIGCVAESVVGGSHEIEQRPAVSVWLATLPGDVATFHATFWGDADDPSFHGWPEADEGPFLLLADPFTFPANLLLEHLNEKMPGTIVMGGMASGAGAPGETRLFRDRDVMSEGAVGVRLPPGARLLPVVSQGCRPIGRSFTVTKAEENVIYELGGRPAMERVRETFAALPVEERELMSQGLMLGRVIDEYKTEFSRGDFLMRGVLGADPESGAIAVGDRVGVGETVQFHVRDAGSADEDLRAALERARGGLAPDRVAGALLFTCNGRGTRMFPEPHHDAGTISEQLGGLPLAGFFCAGEVGPVAGKNFLHGFTASIALFVEPQPQPS